MFLFTVSSEDKARSSFTSSTASQAILHTEVQQEQLKRANAKQRKIHTYIPIHILTYVHIYVHTQLQTLIRVGNIEWFEIGDIFSIRNQSVEWTNAFATNNCSKH